MRFTPFRMTVVFFRPDSYLEVNRDLFNFLRVFIFLLVQKNEPKKGHFFVGVSNYATA
jgi:hypothetical protein